MAGAAYRFDPPLLEGRLLRRYKRFLADIELADGRVITAHCTNTGSMTGCSDVGARVFVSRADGAHRRLRFTWELSSAGRVLVGINTLVPNRLVARAVGAGRIPELAGYAQLRREVRCGERSRLDLLLEDPARAQCWIEIKNATLREGDAALFPDAVSERGRRHLELLAALAARGHRAVILFVVQRADCRRLRPADAIDPAYGETLRRVVAQGVEALAYRARVRRRVIAIDRRLPVEL